MIVPRPGLMDTRRVSHFENSNARKIPTTPNHPIQAHLPEFPIILPEFQYPGSRRQPDTKQVSGESHEKITFLVCFITLFAGDTARIVFALRRQSYR
jgi:hypothetical protein